MVPCHNDILFCLWPFLGILIFLMSTPLPKGHTWESCGSMCTGPLNRCLNSSRSHAPPVKKMDWGYIGWPSGFQMIYNILHSAAFFFTNDSNDLPWTAFQPQQVHAWVGQASCPMRRCRQLSFCIKPVPHYLSKHLLHQSNLLTFKKQKKLFSLEYCWTLGPDIFTA